MTEKVMYGTHAAQVTVTLSDGSSHQQWFCYKCKRIWGPKDQHMASWCCCTHMICECGKEHSKSWTRCDDCRAKRDHESWYAKPEVDWDGEWPIALADGDQYFFNEDDLRDYLYADRTFHEIDEAAESLRLTSCHPNKPSYFEVNDYCCDELGEDQEVPDAGSIDKRINAILDEIGTLSWSANSVRLNVRQILKAIGYEGTACD